MDEHAVACLSMSLLKDRAYETLLNMSSPFIKDRKMLLAGHNHLSLFTWDLGIEVTPQEEKQFQLNELECLLSCYDIMAEPPVLLGYQILDDQTTQAAVSFSNGKAAVVLYKDHDKWTFHNILFVDAQFGLKWHASLQAAKQAFSLDQGHLTDEDADYWNSYTQSSPELVMKLI